MSSYLWQNFLTNKSDIDYIVTLVRETFLKNNLKYIIEIWPWKWAITKYLSDLPIILFEKDESFTQILEKFWKQIVWWDVLKADIEKIFSEKNLKPEEVLVFWNLPYYITSPIIRRFFENQNFGFGIFLIQKEVAEKLETKAKKKSYLWWLINFSHNIFYKKTVWKKSFTPAPKVDSVIIYLEKKESENIEFSKLKNFLDIVSPYKRKTLWKIWKMVWEKWWEFVNIFSKNETKRLEELTWKDII